MPSRDLIENRLVIAAAGSGKTQLIVDAAASITGGRVLITTFTEANEGEIARRFIDDFGCIPSHVTIQTWFSFLIQHGAKPYQGTAYPHDITGLVLAEGRSAQYVKESDTKKHYFTADGRIYSDKLAKFSLKCDAASHGAVLDRISRIYPHIFVDEVQDFAGDDLDVLSALIKSPSRVTLVGDPRQSVYATSKAAKNKGIRGSRLIEYFEVSGSAIAIDVDSLGVNHRCVQPLCDLANSLYPHLPSVQSGQHASKGHEGVFLVRSSLVDGYLGAHRPHQLRYNVTAKGVRPGYPTLNMGLSKGLQFDDVLIYPTESMLTWLSDKSQSLADETRSKFYVAITRARFSVGIVTDLPIPGFVQYSG
jgi:DNA helicase II / ATP-dependent DNA helicase PcrA